jgi:hypothetical protein
MFTNTVYFFHMSQTFPQTNQYYSGICATNIVPAVAVCLHGCHDVHEVGVILSTGNCGLQ